MARANTTTLLSLDDFAAIIGMHPLHFNQVTVEDLAPAAICGQPIVQYSWQQADSISRDELAQAIDDAERQLAMHLNFKLRPTWEVDTVPFQGLYPTRAKTSWGHVAVGGQKALALVAAASAVVYTDPDGDGYSELATITTAVTFTATDEVHIFYPGHFGAAEWEIPTVSISIAGGVATIKTRRERLVIESALEQLAPRAVDGLVNANFLTTVDVYRVYNDPAVGATFNWSNYTSSCGCGSPTCKLCTTTTQDGCLVPQNNRLGFVKIFPATWSAVTNEHTSVCFTECSMPDSVTLYYKAGMPLVNGGIVNELKRAITWFAVSLLDRPLCACDSVASIARYYQVDLALAVSSQSGANSYRVPIQLLNNPLGTTRGAAYAWRFVQKYSIGEAVCGR